MPKIDLLPCPFCGNVEALRMERIPFVYNLVCAVANGGCGASTGWNHATPEEAVKSWNTRASGWISCSVKKPEAYKSVLVVIKDNGGYTWINIGETDEDGNWMIGGEFWYSKSDTSITHWMPTPELPKEVEE